MRRLDPQNKCPACGWRLDADAYRCPKCLIYFCYKCRKRVQKDDQQYQCVNQTCDTHGKLVCGACTTMVDVEGDIPTYVEGYWHWLIWLAGILGLISMIWLGFWGGIILATVIYTGMSVWLSKEGKNYFDKTTYHKGKVRDYRACIECKQPVEILHY